MSARLWSLRETLPFPRSRFLVGNQLRPHYNHYYTGVERTPRSSHCKSLCPRLPNGCRRSLPVKNSFASYSFYNRFFIYCQLTTYRFLSGLQKEKLAVLRFLRLFRKRSTELIDATSRSALPSSFDLCPSKITTWNLISSFCDWSGKKPLKRKHKSKLKLRCLNSCTTSLYLPILYIEFKLIENQCFDPLGYECAQNKVKLFTRKINYYR